MSLTGRRRPKTRSLRADAVSEPRTLKAETPEILHVLGANRVLAQTLTLIVAGERPKRSAICAIERPSASRKWWASATARRRSAEAKAFRTTPTP